MKSITINNLSKSYQIHPIINNLYCYFDSSKINFIIGKNGSGKSTLIRCIIDHVKYSGEIIKDNLTFAYAPDYLNLPPYSTVFDYLKTFIKCDIKMNDDNIERIIDSYLDKYQITSYKYHLIKELSKGTYKKVILIQTLIQDKDVYIFDEPIDGIDSYSKIEFIDEIKSFLDLDKIVIISTHYLAEYRIDARRVIEIKNE